MLQRQANCDAITIFAAKACAPFSVAVVWLLVGLLAAPAAQPSHASIRQHQSQQPWEGDSDRSADEEQEADQACTIRPSRPALFDFPAKRPGWTQTRISSASRRVLAERDPVTPAELAGRNGSGCMVGNRRAGEVGNNDVLRNRRKGL